MTFFYDLNKKLAGIKDKPAQTHGQLNERANSPVDEGLGDVVKKVGAVAKKVGGAVLNKVGHGDDAEMLRDLQRKMGATGAQVHGKKSMAQPNEGVDKEAFAALAPPKDKITFADKIAGAKKEVDEMLGDVAATAIKKAIGGHGGKEEMESTGDYSAKKARAGKDIGKPGKNFGKIAKGAAERYGSAEAGKRVAGAVLNKLRHKGANEGEMDEGWDEMMKSVKDRAEKPKVGSIERGALHDIEHTATGRKVTRRVDPNTGHSVGSEDDKPADGEKRGRGRPKGPAKAPERVTANATKHKGGRKVKEGDNLGDDVKQAMAVLKKAGYKVSKASEGAEELDEKAVSKKQQRFMGMVHATQKGEKAPSKEVAKVAKSMGKKDAEDFASTKHKGLPEKKKPEGKKKEKTEEAGGSGTPTASSGFSYGKGIYDSMNRDLENMIKESMARLDESMSVNMSSDSEGQHSLTVTAQEEDAVKLADILKSAGLGGGSEEGYGGGGYKSACDCGTPDCGCGDEETEIEVDENSPNWPTNQEEGDAFEYSGGLNGPKSTGQSTTPVLASQEERQMTAEEEEAELSRMIEMAGIQEAKKVEEDDVEEGNKFTGNLAKARAAGKKEADLDGDGDLEKVDEGILASTRDLWKKYQG